MFRKLLAAIALAAGLAGPVPAGAAPLGVPAVRDAAPGTAAPWVAQGAGIVPVYGGCGPLGHRGPYGGCRPGGQWGGYVPGRACPPGWHIGPYGRRCWRDAGLYRGGFSYRGGFYGGYGPRFHRPFAYRAYGYGYRRHIHGYRAYGYGHRRFGWRRFGWHRGGLRRFGGRFHGGGFRGFGFHRGGFHRGGGRRHR